MKKSLYILLLIACSSCTKVLDLTPQDKITAINFWKTATDAENATTGIYDAIQGMVPFTPVALDASGDATLANVLPYSQFSAHGIPSDNTIVNNYWQFCYIGIGRANDVLSNVSAMDAGKFAAGQQARILAEAYFTRAFLYYSLIKVYGGVPIVTKPYDSFNADFTIAKSTMAQVLDQIIADLKIAKASLPVSYGDAFSTRGRGTQGSASALLAKAYLTKKDYANAVTEANGVIANTTYTLAQGSAAYANMFSASGKNSAESIFEIQYVSNSSESNGIFSFYMPPNGIPAGQTGGSYTVVPTTKIINAFEAGDIRKAGSISVSTATLPLTYVNKYVRQTSGPEPNVIQLRLADIYLIAAEAYNGLGQTTEASNMLNIIRRRAFNLPLATVSVRDFPSADDISKGYTLALAIENERFKELCFEGHRFFDLVRTGRAETVLNITTNQTVWPLPLREVGRNPRLIQNPGY